MNEFPPIQSDEFRVHSVVEWSDELLEEKVTEYWEFLNSPQMPRATKAAHWLLQHTGFEVDCRAGVYDDRTS